MSDPIRNPTLSRLTPLKNQLLLNFVTSYILHISVLVVLWTSLLRFYFSMDYTRTIPFSLPTSTQTSGSVQLSRLLLLPMLTYETKTKMKIIFSFQIHTWCMSFHLGIINISRYLKVFDSGKHISLGSTSFYYTGRGMFRTGQRKRNIRKVTIVDRTKNCGI